MQEPTDNGASTGAFTMVLSLIVVTVAAVAMVSHIVVAAPSWVSWLPVPSVVCLVPATLRALRGGPPWPAVAAIGASAILVAIHANLPLLGLVLLYEARLDELVRSPTLHSDCHMCECPSIPVGPWSFHGILSGAQGGTWLRTDCSGDGLIGIDTLSTGLAHAPDPARRTSSAKASAFTEAFARARHKRSKARLRRGLCSRLRGALTLRHRPVPPGASHRGLVHLRSKRRLLTPRPAVAR